MAHVLYVVAPGDRRDNEIFKEALEDAGHRVTFFEARPATQAALEEACRKMGDPAVDAMVVGSLGLLNTHRETLDLDPAGFLRMASEKGKPVIVADTEKQGTLEHGTKISFGNLGIAYLNKALDGEKLPELVTTSLESATRHRDRATESKPRGPRQPGN